MNPLFTPTITALALLFARRRSVKQVHILDFLGNLYGFTFLGSRAYGWLVAL